MRHGIAVAGSVLLDKIYNISAYPSVGELTQIRSVEFSVGGCVPNVSIDLKKIAPTLPIYAIGKIGNDGDGKFVLNDLKKNSVDVSGITVCDTKTSFTDVMSITGGQRTFFTYAGASAEFGEDDVDLATMSAKMLHLGYFLLLDRIDKGDGCKILKKAIDLGIKTSIDLVTENSDRYSLVCSALPYTDNLIINESEAGMLTGISPSRQNLPQITKKLMEMGVRERVIIHMPDLSVCLSRSGYTELPSYDLPKGYIQGTTGAGDAFCAGALYKIHEDAQDIEILEFASAAAVMALSSPDATSGILTAEQTLLKCGSFERKKLI